MEKRPSQVSRWVDHIWSAIGVTVGASHDGTSQDGTSKDNRDTPSITRLEEGVELHIFSGFQVKLYVDECDSYYHNLVSPSPHCYVVVRQNEDEAPAPFLVSLSFDEADAYAEGDDEVFAVAIPPELYRWSEAFVLAHYCPQQRKKRKRQDWWENESRHHRQ